MDNVIRDKRFQVPDRKATHFTIGLIGKAIRDGSSYLPIRNYAASIAAKAPRKNYLEQLKALWREFLSRWRYVRDPHETETLTMSPKALYNLVMGHNGGVGRGLGAGDCDCATAAFGSLAKSIGFPVRIATIAPPGSPGVGFTHVFPQIYVNNLGWINADPVLYPNADLGAIAPFGRMAIWDLKGNLIATRGVPARTLKKVFQMQRSKRNVRNNTKFSRVRYPGPGGSRLRRGR